jgi:hypothetical protein
MKNREELIKLLQAVRHTTSDIDKQADRICDLFNVSQQSELLELLTEVANSKTIYSNNRHRLIAKKLLSSYSG